MQNAWDKILDLIKKTGDRCVVVDGRDSGVYVVMDIKNYESSVLRKSRVANLTEDELLDRINRDISIWQSAQGTAENMARETQHKTAAGDDDDDDEYYIEPVIAGAGDDD